MTWQDYTDAATPGPDFDPNDTEIESGWPQSRAWRLPRGVLPAATWEYAACIYCDLGHAPGTACPPEREWWQ